MSYFPAAVARWSYALQRMWIDGEVTTLQFFARRIGAIAAAVLFAACAGRDAASASPTCIAPADASGSPSSIGEVITLANALFAARTAEVTLPCFVESLDRPLGTLAVDSIFSVQPSVGRRSPRIFLFSGEVVMSVAPAGSGTDLLELAEYTAPTRSIKAEISFPLRAPLAPADPYDRVRLGNLTSCSGCHGAEEPAKQVTLTQAFESDVLRPRSQDEVPLPFLEDQALACDPRAEPQRCDLLTAVFGHGDVRVQRFSPDAKTIYGD